MGLCKKARPFLLVLEGDKIVDVPSTSLFGKPYVYFYYLFGWVVLADNENYGIFAIKTPFDKQHMVMEKDFNKEYEYKGLVVNGFAMIFFTFILIPGLIVLFTLALMEHAEVLAVIIHAVLGILFILGCIGYFVQEPNQARVMIFFG